MQQSQINYSPPRHRIQTNYTSRYPTGSLMAAMTGLHCEFYPLHGLFKCRQHGYLAEFRHDDFMHLQQEYIQIDLVYHAAQQFLHSQQNGILFIPTRLALLQSRSFRHELSQLMIAHPTLFDRLALLLQYDAISHSNPIHELGQTLSMAGIALAVDMQEGQLTDMEPDTTELQSPYVLIHYDDQMILNQSGTHRLSETIRSCRKAAWPILVDYRLHGKTAESAKRTS